MKFKKLFGRKKQNRRAPRANEFMLESLEPRLLLSATPMIAAAVTTDHLDYAPGETAVITASNTVGDGVQFAAGELVRFQVTRTDGMADVAGTTADAGPAGNEAWYVIDGVGGFAAHLGSDVSGDGMADWIAPDNDHMVNGSVSSTWFVEEQYRNSSLLVTATGQESGAVATQAFTDANLNTTTVVTSSGASIYGDTVTLTATVTPAVGGTTRPVGSVEFFDNGVSLGVMGSAGIGAGSSSTFALTVSSLTAGSHAVTAVFTGGANVSDSFNNSTSGILTQTVSKKALVGSFGADNKTYDGTTVAAVLFADFGVGQLVGNDFVTLDGGIANFDTKDAGFNHIVTLTGATLGGADASNYSLASITTTIADIDQAIALVTVNGFTGAFDGLPHGATGTALGVDVGGAALGSSLNLGLQFTAVGTYVADWVFTGGTNYTNQTGSVAIVINNAVTTTTTTVSSSAATSTYGDAVTFTAIVSAGSGTVAPTGTVAFFDGVTLLGTDSVVDSTGVGTSTWSFTTGSLKAGAHAIHAVYSATGSFSGSQSTDISQTVNQKSLTGSFTAANKVYDATTAATLTRILTGVLGTDVVTLAGTGTFDTKDVGTGKVVTITGAGLAGADAGNYSLTANSTTTANVTVLGITGSFTAANKVYDATTTATLTRTLTGVLGADVVTLTGTGTFDTKDVGTGKVVTITGAGLTGADAGNYSLTANSTTTANITALGITGSFTAANKVYDATTTATVQTRTLTGVIAGDSVSLVGGTAAFGNANAGLNKVVTLTGAGLTGTDSGNYSLTSVNTTTADITALGLTGSFTAANKVYDATTTAALTRTLTGVLGADVVVLVGTGTFDTKDVGTGKIVTITGAGLTGAAAGNYSLTANSTTTADITKAIAQVSVSGFTGAFDGLPHGATGTVLGVDAGGAALGSSLNLGAQFTLVGTYLVDWVFTGGTNYTDQSGSVTIVISDAVTATTTTVSSSAATSTYGDAVTFTATVNAGSGTVAPTGTVAFFDGATLLGSDSVVDSTGVGTSTWSFTTASLNAGAHAIHAVYSATGGFADSTSADITQTVSKAVATVTVSGFTGTYNAAAHGATGSATGVAGDLAAAGSSLNLGASFTNAPGGTANWVFTGGLNYTDQSGSVAIVINKAAATVTVSGFTGTYNAAAHGATGSVTGVAGDLAAAGSSLNLGASFTNAPGGTANWVFTGGTNYTDQSGSAAIVINKAVALVTVTGFTGPFDGLAHGATGAVLGVDVGGAALGTSLNLGASFINAPGGTANWVFTGGINYSDQSGSVAIVINNVVVSTTTTVSSNAATSIYGNAVTFTAIVTAGSGNAAPTGSIAFFDGATLLGIDSVANSTGVGTSTWSITTASLTAGAHAIHAVYSATGNFSGSQSADMTQTVNQRSLTGNFTAANKVYDATTGAVVQIRTLTGVLAGDSVSLIGGTAAFANANASLNKTVTLTGATLSGAASGNYNLTSVNSTTANITAKSLTGNFTAANKVYDATTTAAVQIRTLTGVIGVDVGNVILTGGTAAFANANVGIGKTVTLTGAILTGAAQANYSLASVNTTTANITAKSLTGSFTAANKVYDATTAATLTRVLTGVLGADAVTLTGTGTFDTKDVGTGKVVTITGAGLTGAAAGNYSLTASSTTTANITAKSLTGSFTAANKTYDATTAATVQTRTLTGVIGVEAVNLIGGTATFSDANAGLNKTVTLTGATLNGAGAINYSLTSVNTTTANINKAVATVSVTGYAGVYIGAAEQASGTALGVLGEGLSGLDLSGTVHTNAGTYSDAWVFTDVTGNYNNASGTVSSTIDKAVATVTVNGFTGTFDNLPHGATGTVVGVDTGSAALGSSLNLGASFTAVPGGTANWSFLGGTNYTDQSGSVAIVISNAIVTTTTTVSSSASTSIYGNSVIFTATVSAGSGSAAPTGTVSFFDGATLLGTDSVANSTGVGTSTWSITTASLTAGAHAIRAVYSATGNFAGSQSADIAQTVNKATATLTVTGYFVTYDGTAHQATATATGVLGESLSGVNLSGTSHTNAGTYTDTVTFTDVTGNYLNATKYVKDYILQAKATITVTGYNVTYDGTAHTATGTATGVLGESLSGLNLSGTTHTNVGSGSYSDIVTFTDQTGNYKNATKYVKDYISKATVTLSVTGYAVRFDGAAHTATGTATGVLGESLSGVNVSATTHTNVGTYSDTVTFTDQTGNYKNAIKFVKDFIR